MVRQRAQHGSGVSFDAVVAVEFCLLAVQASLQPGHISGTNTRENY